MFSVNYSQRPRINAVRTLRRALHVALFLFKLNFLLFHQGLVSNGDYALLWCVSSTEFIILSADFANTLSGNSSRVL